MPDENDPNRAREWYSVSVDTLRAWGTVLLLLVVAGVSFLGYRLWLEIDLERRAAASIAEARILMTRLRGEEVLTSEPSAGESYQRGLELLQSAGTAFEAGRHETALEQGAASRSLFRSLLGDEGDQGVAVAELVSVRGRVDVRRVDGSWQEARARTDLYAGDHVRTGPSGLAEVQLLDGTLTTVRANSQIIVPRRRSADAEGGETLKMDYGWVNLNTSDWGGTVETPDAEAAVAADSEVVVTYDSDERRGLFATYQGGMEVASKSGDRRVVGEMEQMVQAGEELSEPTPLPPAPLILDPSDNAELDLERVSELVLAWEPVDGAEEYTFEVARNHLFVDTVIEDTRTETSATLGLRGEGSFLWRVAAVTPDGMRGPWSGERSFLVSSARREPTSADAEPPALEVGDVESYGNIFIVEGSTEPGAFVDINGEPVPVRADGTFTKTVEINEEGRASVRIRARDPAGNETVVTRQVLVEIV